MNKWEQLRLEVLQTLAVPADLESWPEEEASALLVQARKLLADETREAERLASLKPDAAAGLARRIDRVSRFHSELQATPA